jgi:lactoylglutathione lyase
MITKVATVALYVYDQDRAVEFWTDRIRFEVRTKRPLGIVGSWIEIAPPGADSCLVLYPKSLMPDWVEHKPSIVFDCDDAPAIVAALQARGVIFTQEPKAMKWGSFAAFLDDDGYEHGLRGHQIGDMPLV